MVPPDHHRSGALNFVDYLAELDRSCVCLASAVRLLATGYLARGWTSGYNWEAPLSSEITIGATKKSLSPVGRIPLALP